MSAPPLRADSRGQLRMYRLPRRRDLIPTARMCLWIPLLGALVAGARGAAPVLPPPEQAIIARVDSLWLAEARDAAHALVREHVPRARAARDSLFLLHLLARQGQMWAALNRSREALPVLREALPLADAFRVEELRRACRRWMGVALYAEGSLEEGVAQFRELLDLSRANGDTRHEGYGWMGLAYHDWRTDRPAEARQNYERAAELLRGAGDLRGELWALIGLNIAYSQLGDYARAIAGNERIIAIGRETGMRSVEALGHNNLGALLYSLGDPGEALAHFEQAQGILEQEGDLREGIVAGRNVGVCEIALGRTQAALDRLRRLLGASEREGYHDLRIGLLGHMADAYRKQGAYPLAARLEREALSLKDRLTAKEESEALLGLSDALAAMDSSQVALGLLRLSAPRILAEAAPMEECRFRVGLGRRLLDQGHYAEAAEVLLPVEARGAELGLAGVWLEAMPLLARARRAMGDPDSALALLQRARRLWEADRGLPLDPEWREQRGAAACDLFAQLTALVLEHSPGRSREECIREAFEILQAYKARTLLERMHGPGREVQPAATAEPAFGALPFTLADLRSRVLGPGEIFLDALFGPEQLLLFACTREECRAALLPGAALLAKRLRLYHELLSTPPPEGDGDAVNRAMIVQASRELADTLLAPFAELIRSRQRVILAPDGALNLVPLATLLASAGREDDALLKEAAPRTLSRVPAASVLAALHDSAASTRNAAGRILALAEPVTARDPLPGTGREVRWLERTFASVDAGLSDRGCEGEAWQACLAPYGVLHFAMHTAADDHSPWRSSIDLGAAASDSGPRMVSASEIATAKVCAKLVVLSSCESARGAILSGEGVQGLASAFLAAGARAVLATLWTVDDAVAARFMERFYEALANGESAAGAVGRAQAELRADPRTAHPFYWAGFELVGDGNLRLEFARRRQAWWRWPVTAACLLAVGACVQRAGRRWLGV
jgi:tetratricopeptide (TPR) repeat protein